MNNQPIGILAVLAHLKGEAVEMQLMSNALRTVYHQPKQIAAKVIEPEWVDCACGEGDYEKGKQTMCDGCLQAERELMEEESSEPSRGFNTASGCWEEA
jgi:hypothetical protein